MAIFTRKNTWKNDAGMTQQAVSDEFDRIYQLLTLWLNNSNSNTDLALVGASDGVTGPTGTIGEYVVSTVGSTSVATGSYTAMTSITLSAGDWDISGLVSYSGSVTTNPYLAIAISTTSGSSAGTTLGYDSAIAPTVEAGATGQATIPRKRVNISSDTTYYLNARFPLGGGADTCFGTISARRMR